MAQEARLILLAALSLTANGWADTLRYTTVDESGRKITVEQTINPDPNGPAIKIPTPLDIRNAPRARPWNAEVVSIYIDEKTGQNIAISGGGTLVRLDETFRTRYFVMTASHVSSGDQLEIRLPGASEPAKVVRRFADPLVDVELVEIKSPTLKPEMALATWSAKDRKFWVDSAWSEGWQTLALNPFIHGDSSAYVPGPSQSIGVDAALALPLDAKDTKPAAASRLWLLNGEREIAADLSVNPGTSGQALVLRTPSGSRWMLVGPALKSSRQFPLSYFPSPSAVASTFQSLLQDEKTSPDVRWKVRDGLTYRKTAADGAEIWDGSTRLIGNGSTRDGGNGSTRDGGNGSTRDGGNGSTRDGGTGGRVDSADPVAVWKNLGISPGMIWKGQPALALQVQRGSNSITLWGDTSTLLLLRDRLQPASAYTITPVGPETDFIDMLRKKTGAPAGDFQLQTSTGSVSVRGDEITWSLGEAGQRVRIRMSKSGAFLEPPTDRFYPVIRAKDEAGVDHTLDLRDFFMTEIGNTEDPKDVASLLQSGCAFDCGSKPSAWSEHEFTRFVQSHRAPMIKDLARSTHRHIFEVCATLPKTDQSPVYDLPACSRVPDSLPAAPSELQEQLQQILKKR